jgi:hypothetical protein
MRIVVCFPRLSSSPFIAPTGTDVALLLLKGKYAIGELAALLRRWSRSYIGGGEIKAPLEILPLDVGNGVAKLALRSENQREAVNSKGVMFRCRRLWQVSPSVRQAQ